MSPMISIIQRHLAKTYFQGFFELLFKISLIGMNYGSGMSLLESGEFTVLELVNHSLLNSHIIFFDVGANVGDYTQALVARFGPKSEIYSFEPTKLAFKRLSKRFRNKNFVHLYNIGLSNKSARLTIFAEKSGSSASSLFKRRLDHAGTKFLSQEKVKLETLDTFCKKHSINQIDFFKIDVEGNELAVLEGANKLLAKKRIKFIQFEQGGSNIEARTYFQDFFYLLHSNYRIYRIVQNGLTEIKEYNEFREIFMYSNYLAVLK